MKKFEQIETILSIISIVLLAYVLLCWINICTHNLDSLNGTVYQYPFWNILANILQNGRF